MVATHKHAGASLHAKTSLGRDDLALVAQQAAEGAHGNAWNSPGRVRLERATSAGLDFSVQSVGPIKRELMTFALRVTPGQRGGGHDVRVAIMSFKTMQQKVGGVVPAGSKRLLGYVAYTAFMHNVAAGIMARDSHAQIAITDGEHTSMTGGGRSAMVTPSGETHSQSHPLSSTHSSGSLNRSGQDWTCPECGVLNRNGRPTCWGCRAAATLQTPETSSEEDDPGTA